MTLSSSNMGRCAETDTVIKQGTDGSKWIGGNFTEEKRETKSCSAVNERRQHRKRGEEVKRLRQMKKESHDSMHSPPLTQ